ncbi:MAG: histidine--tRNA ligase [Chloroflexi bacterium]|nr:histidine--tRNA ligase [Chloroflexota bacterium]
MPKFRAPRGAADILPEEQPYWDFVSQQVERLCRLYGYRRIEPPLFEDVGLFERSVGAETDIVQKEMYTFQDKGGDTLALRPEGTASVCRAYLEHGMQSLPQPVRLYYLLPMFRYERPQAGRYRQFHQFGFEAIGEADAALDAEVIDLSWQLYRAFGLKGLRLALNSIGTPESRPRYHEALRAYYQPHLGQVCPDCRARFERAPLRLLDCKQDAALAEAAPRSLDYLDGESARHFQQLCRYLDGLDVPYTLDHRLVRGLDYYTRTVYEIQPAQEGSQSTIGAGGRYDGLIQELGGPPTPGVGFAGGMERIILNLKRQGVALAATAAPRAFVAFVGEEAKAVAVRVTGELRRAGVAAALGLGDRSLKAQLRQASATGAAYAVILGADELAAGAATVRDLAQATQERVPLGTLAERLRAPGSGPSSL